MSGLLLACVSAQANAQTGQTDAPATPVAAPPTLSGDGRSLTNLTAAQLFDIADQARAAGRDADAEAIYKALAQDPTVTVRSEARFRLGMMYADQKHYTDAALAFRAILDEQPEAARVRLELARVLTAMGDEGGARAQLRQAQASGLPPEVALVVDRFQSALRSNKTFGGNFEAALAPDSNINRATNDKTLDTPLASLTLSPDAQQQSGIGAHLSGQVYARLRLSPQLALVPRLSGDGTFYKKGEFNDLSGSTLLGLEWQAGAKDRLMPSGGVTWRTFGGHPYVRTITGDMRWLHNLGRRGQLDLSFSYGSNDYSKNNLQDGDQFSLGATVQRALSARSGLGISLTGMRQTAVDAAYATTSGGVTLLGWRDMGKTTLFANVTARRLESDAGLILGPFGSLPRRKEWFLRAGLGGTFRQIEIAGFSPVVRVAYERNISTVGIYDYHRVNVDFGITRAF
jgi:tetratricopeptide (TPR) repeat protein